MVFEKQGAFIKGRTISDNIFLMHELVRTYHRKGGKTRCVLKIDIIKAYDIVRWELLFAMMVIMKFPTKYINWVKNYVTTATFSLKLKGTKTRRSNIPLFVSTSDGRIHSNF